MNKNLSLDFLPYLTFSFLTLVLGARFQASWDQAKNVINVKLHRCDKTVDMIVNSQD